ncbi:hypothetical protein L202_00815 [Cryptococcus amylolentus CBS 6039]|uniref:Altered inheritance of mitochondria protein 6 n=1 Tax=Cryptococcus amylolentus CBS 6039 TaxID=1295533 RepID=A0A1E3IB36_9TREE|nr:hypothetical protein L202_00815 [Cryptococcus amylolentus CBS 6039]ODN84971.1 hypothetical protein L202_00815 [Cryptococcus amylolentus CBS 6039]
MLETRQTALPSLVLASPSTSSASLLIPETHRTYGSIPHIPSLLQTQSPHYASPRSSSDPRGERPPLPRINSATPLIPRSSGLCRDLRRGHWHFPWHGHRNCRKHRSCGASGLTGSIVIMTGMVLGLVLGVMLWVYGWMGREERLSVLPPLGKDIANGNFSTKGIKKMWACSHNDEMQGQNALSLALSLGYGWIEVDTHLTATPSKHHSDNVTWTLLAGHDLADLDPRKSLKTLYLDPLLAILDKNNEGRDKDGEEEWNGVYEDDPREEIVLMIDMKSDGDETWPHLQKALEPFLAKGYLTTYNTTSRTLSPGPLTIVGTGNTPLHQVFYAPLRYIFFDAPLVDLHKPHHLPATPSGPAVTIEWSPSLSPIASSKFPLQYYLAAPPTPFPAYNPFLCNLQLTAAVAHEKGIQSRWWGVLHKPGWARRRMWEVVWQSGVGVVNADELEELKSWLEGKEGVEREGFC